MQDLKCKSNHNELTYLQDSLLHWNTSSHVLSYINQNCGGLQNEINTFEDYLEEVDKQLTAHQVAYMPHIISKNKKYQSFNLCDKETLCYLHSLVGCNNYPIEFGQALLQKPEYYVDYKGRHKEFSGHILNNLDWINNSLYPIAINNFNCGNDFYLTITKMVQQKFCNVNKEMQGILIGYLNQKPKRALFLIDIEFVGNAHFSNVLEPLRYFYWIEPVYKQIVTKLKKLEIPYMTVVTGRGYHILTSIPLWEDKHYNPAMFALMEAGGIVQRETANHLLNVHCEENKNHPVSLLAEKIHQGICRVMHFLLASLIPQTKSHMRIYRFSPQFSFYDDENSFISLDMTAMLYSVNRRAFGMPGQIYSKKHNPLIVRIVRQINENSFFNGKPKKLLEQLLTTRTNIEQAKEYMSRTGARIPDSSSHAFCQLVKDYFTSCMKPFYDQLEIAIDPALVEHLHKSNYLLIRKLCPDLDNAFSATDIDNLLNPKFLSYFYQELNAHGFDINIQRDITYALYCDPRKNVDLAHKDCRALRAKWPLLINKLSCR